MRELEQAIRQVLLTDRCVLGTAPRATAAEPVAESAADAFAVLARLCAALYEQVGSYEGIARLVNPDRRTARRYVGRYRARSGG